MTLEMVSSESIRLACASLHCRISKVKVSPIFALNLKVFQQNHINTKQRKIAENRNLVSEMFCQRLNWAIMPKNVLK